MAKVAHGLADDLLTTLALARDRTRTALLIAPAMNVEMWENPATQRNAAQLRADGIALLGPAQGAQACGETGYGRMLEPAELLEDIVAFFQPKVLAGKRVLLTAGPTFEAIDPVRGITNLSSGKTGFALARAARDAGADVVLVAGPTALATPRGVKRIDATSAADMHKAVLGALPADVFIGVAAVADWRVANPSDRKIKKDDKATPPSLQFDRNADILAAVAALPDPPFCVGFAAETEDVVENAKRKLVSKKVAMVDRQPRAGRLRRGRLGTRRRRRRRSHAVAARGQDGAGATADRRDRHPPGRGADMLEPKDGDFVAYIDALQRESAATTGAAARQCGGRRLSDEEGAGQHVRRRDGTRRHARRGIESRAFRAARPGREARQGHRRRGRRRHVPADVARRRRPVPVHRRHRPARLRAPAPARRASRTGTAGSQTRR